MASLNDLMRGGAGVIGATKKSTMIHAKHLGYMGYSPAFRSRALWTPTIQGRRLGLSISSTPSKFHDRSSFDDANC